MNQPSPGAGAPRPDDSPPGRDPPPAVEDRCRRCRKRIASEAEEPHYHETGLCFWCANIDSQG